MPHETNHPHKLAYSIKDASEAGVFPWKSSTTRKFVNSGELKTFLVGALRFIGHETAVQFVQKLEAAGYTPIPSGRRGSRHE